LTIRGGQQEVTFEGVIRRWGVPARGDRQRGHLEVEGNSQGWPSKGSSGGGGCQPGVTFEGVIWRWRGTSQGWPSKGSSGGGEGQQEITSRPLTLRGHPPGAVMAGCWVARVHDLSGVSDGRLQLCLQMEAWELSCIDGGGYIATF
jgi:hypothetical protein